MILAQKSKAGKNNRMRKESQKKFASDICVLFRHIGNAKYGWDTFVRKKNSKHLKKENVSEYKFSSSWAASIHFSESWESML